MPTSVGGINIRIGADISQIGASVKQAGRDLRKLRSILKEVSLRGVVQGDPFSAVKSHLKTTRAALNTVFSAWQKHIKDVNAPFDKLTQKSRKTTEAIIRDWRSLAKKARRLSVDLAGGSGFDITGYGKGGKGVTRAPMSQFFEKGKVEEIRNRLNKSFQYLSEEGKRGVTKFLDALNKNVDIKGKDLEAKLKGLQKHFKKAGLSIKRDMEELGDKLQKAYKDQEKAEYQLALKQAKDPSLIRRERVKRIKEYRISIARLTKEIKMNINVEANKRTLYNKLNLLEKEGLKLHKKEVIALRDLRKEQEKLNKSSRQAASGRGFMTAEWFKERAVWFVQLRLFWSAYRAAGEAARDLVEYEYQLARAMRTARSETKSAEQVTRRYADAMREAVSVHGMEWRDVGEALYQLGSAGLSAEESLSALNSTLTLIRGTEGDVREVTKAVAGLYNNFADQLKDMTTAGEKFAFINNVIAEIWSRHQVEIDELVQGYKMVIAMGTQAGLTFTEISAMLGVLNDHMIKSGRAGRSLQNVLMRISRQPVEFALAFDVAFDPTKPMNFVKIMDELNNKMTEGTASAYSIATAFQYLGIRGAPSFQTLVRYWGEVREEMQKLGTDMEAAAKLEEKLLDTLRGRWQQMLGNLRRWLSEGGPILDKIKSIIDIGMTGVSALATQQVVIKEIAEFRGLGDFEAQKAYIKNMTKQRMEMLTKFREEVARKLEGIFAKRPGEESDVATINLMELMFRAEQKREAALVEKEKEKNRLLLERVKLGEKINANDFRALMRSKTELQLAYKDPNLSLKERIRLRKQELSIRTRMVYDQKISLDRVKKEKLDIKTIQGQEQEVLRLQDKQLEVARILKNLEKTHQNILLKQLDTKVKTLKTEQSKLLEGKSTVESENRLIEISERLNQYANERKGILTVISQLNKEDVGTIKLTGELLGELADEEKRRRDEKVKRRELERKRREIAVKAEKELNNLADKRFEIEKKGGDNKLELMKIDKQIAEVQKRRSEEYIKLTEDEIEEMRLYERIRDYIRDILELDEKRYRLLNPYDNALKKIEKSIKSVKELWSDIWEMAGRGLGTGLGGVLDDITGGFQDQKQEIEELEKEVEGLEEQYEEALSEGNAERAAEITREINRLNQEINRLEDPLHNIGEAFKRFAKDIIDNIRAIINEWLAMKIAMGIMKGLGAIAGIKIKTDEPELLPARTGGVIPQIKSFQSLSQGGITGNPTLALLGDNRSGKELVIPEENISPDSVSGYTRDSSQPINVINVLSESDIVQAMAGTMGQRVIVNTIGEDIRKRGPTVRNTTV